MTDIDFDRSGHSVFVFGTDTEKTVRQIVLLLLPLGLFSFGLWLCVQEHGVRFADYSALHTLVEIPAIVIAAMVFGIGWNAYEENRPLTLPILACGFLTVGLLDLMHVLSFPGMPNFITPSSPEKAINFWLSARYLAAVTFLAAGLLPWRPMKRLSFRCAILAGCLAFTSLIVWLGLFREDFWPRTFLSGQGLTPFKMKAEYALTLIYFTVTLVLLYRLRRPQPRVLAYLMGASAVTALSELCFSRYRAVDDLCNFVGHVYKAIAYFLVYRGIFVEGVHEPYLRLQASREALRKSEARFQDLLEFEPDGVLLADSACRIAMANAKAEAIFACPRAELIGRSIETLIPEICRAKPSARWHTHRKEKQTLSVGREVWGRRNDGSDFPAEVTLGPLHTEQGLMTIVAVRDITERKQREEERDRLVAILEGTSDLIGIVNADYKPIYINQAGRAMLGLGREEDISALHIEQFHPPQVFNTLLRGGLAEAEKSGVWRGETELVNRFGNKIPLSQVIIAHKGNDGRVAYWSTVARDIADQKQYETMLKFQATHDPLTALPNRFLFRERLEQAMLRAFRNGSLVAVLLVDLDNFKDVNDTLGHDFGDELVKLIGGRLREALREEDTVARLGGDEFAVLLPYITDSSCAAQKAQLLLDAIAQPCRIEHHHILISASIGITVYPGDGDDVHGLLRNADMSMYKAKDEGRSKFRFYTAEMGACLRERLDIVNDLRTALDRSEFTLHYQPRVSLVTGRICGVEALIRWQHPQKGFIAPAKFIPIAEETGLIAQIGEWVFRTACAQAKVWRDKGLAFNRMAVNLSARQFAQPDLVEVVTAVVEQTGLPPQTLELEITESMLMRDRSIAADVLGRLKQLGISLAVDDFGTGYSSLSYLKQFPLDYLKIDRSFIRDLAKDPDDARIVEAIIVLAHSLNLGVIGEGVETPEQAEFLKTRHCDEIQGYYFSKPTPADEVEAMLRTGKTLEFTVPKSLSPLTASA